MHAGCQLTVWLTEQEQSGIGLAVQSRRSLGPRLSTRVLRMQSRYHDGKKIEDQWIRWSACSSWIEDKYPSNPYSRIRSNSRHRIWIEIETWNHFSEFYRKITQCIFCDSSAWSYTWRREAVSLRRETKKLCVMVHNDVSNNIFRLSFRERISMIFERLVSIIVWFIRWLQMKWSSLLHLSADVKRGRNKSFTLSLLYGITIFWTF